MIKFLKTALASLLLLGSASCFAPEQPQSQAQSQEVTNTASPDEPQPQAVGIMATSKNLFLHESDSFQRLKNVVLSGTAYTGPMVISTAVDTLTSIEYRRWSLTNDYANGQNAKWGILLYNEVNCTYTLVHIAGIKAEHAIYQHCPQGMVLLQDLFVFDIGAQGFQQVFRGPEASDPEGYKNTGTHRLVRCQFIKCGQPRGYGRASYAVSMFGRQEGDGSSPRLFWDCPVELEEVTIAHDSQGQYELRGALLVEWRPSLSLKDCVIDYRGTSDRDLVHIHNVNSITVKNTYIHGPTGKFFDIDGADSVVFTSPGFDGGDTKVRIDGVVVGTTDDEIVWAK